jgi:hypothetical protein
MSSWEKESMGVVGVEFGGVWIVMECFVRKEVISSRVGGVVVGGEVGLGVEVLEGDVEGPAELEVVGDGSSADEDSFRRFFFLSFFISDGFCSVSAGFLSSASRLRFFFCFFSPSTATSIQSRVY